MLSPTVRTVGELQGNWWIAHTKSRRDKAVAHLLMALGIGYYLPMFERVRVFSGKRRHMMYPVFSPYVFFCGSVDDSYRVANSSHVGHLIPVVDSSRLVSELMEIERVLASKYPLDPDPTNSTGARRYRVKRGPLEGTTGHVARQENPARLVLPVSLLGFGPSLEIDADLLEPAE